MPRGLEGKVTGSRVFQGPVEQRSLLSRPLSPKQGC